MYKVSRFVVLAGLLTSLSPAVVSASGVGQQASLRLSSTTQIGSTGTSTKTVKFTQQAARAYDFSDSVGVNTHLGYTDTAYYQQPAKIIAALQKMGVRHVRDGLGYWWVAPNLYSIFQQLAAAGIHPELVLPNPNGVPTPTASAMAALLPNYPGVEAVESPNEYDMAGDPNWSTNLFSYMPAVWQTGQQGKVPVIGPSLVQLGSYSALGDVAPYMTYNNLHAYWGGRNPETTGWGGPDSEGNYYGSIPYAFDYLNITGPNVPVMFTESGYVVNNTPSQNIIPEWVEAVYEPRLLLHDWNMGVKRTYIYELMDDPSSTTGYGLLRSDLSARPAYTAVSTLMSVLSDKSTSFSPESLAYTMSGTTSGIETTLLEKQDGSFWLAMWLPGCIWDVNAVKSTPVTAQSITLTAPSGRLIRKTWTFNNAGTASSSTVNAASKSLSITSTITLVEIK